MKEQKQKKNITLTARVDDDTAILFDGLAKRYECKTRAELMQRIVYHLTGQKEFAPLALEANRLVGEKAVISNSGTLPEEAFEILSEIKERLDLTENSVSKLTKETKNTNAICTKNLNYMREKLDEGVSQIESSVKPVVNEVNGMKNDVHKLALATVEIHKSQQNFKEYFDKVFLKVVQATTVDVVDLFVAKFFGKKQEKPQGNRSKQPTQQQPGRTYHND